MNLQDNVEDATGNRAEIVLAPIESSSWKPIRESCTETRRRVRVAPVYNKVLRNPSFGRRKLEDLKRLLQDAGNFSDGSQPNHACLVALVEHLIESATQYGFVDLEVPDVIVWLSMTSVVRALCFLFSKEQFVTLLNQIVSVGGPVCRANVFGEPFTSLVRRVSDGALDLPHAEIVGTSLVQKFQRQFFVSASSRPICDEATNAKQ